MGVAGPPGAAECRARGLPAVGFLVNFLKKESLEMFTEVIPRLLALGLPGFGYKAVSCSWTATIDMEGK